MNKVYLFMLFALVFGHRLSSQIVLNEICVDNEELLADFQGEFPDWIEIYNSGDQPENLGDYFLSDKSADLFKWQFPEMVLPAHSWIVIFASGKNTNQSGEIHTSFKMEEGVEGCYLSLPVHPMLSFIAPHALPSDLSFGSQPDASGHLVYFATPSPGKTNDNSVVEFFDEPNEIVFSHNGGYHNQAFELELLSERTGIEIRYTTDGSPVTRSSSLYTSPIAISENSQNTTGSSFIPTSDTWQTPSNGVRNITVIRAAPFENGYQVAAEVSKSFFVGTNMQTFDNVNIVSLSLDAKDFFSDSSGIYVHGISTYGNFSERGMDSERRIYAEYFGPQGVLKGSQTIGARIHGRSSRFSPQKSIRLHARNRYGNDTIALGGLREGIAHNEVILRAPESLFSTSLFTDELVQTIVRDMDLDLQRQLPAVVFLNGEYWGVHHIREHLGDEYLHSLYGVQKENVDILDWDNELVVLEGNDQAYRDLESFLMVTDFSDESNYQVLSAKVDIASFTDYMIAQLFFANEDFAVNNVRFWKERSDSAKWRFFFFDADATMREHWQNRLEQYLRGDGASDPVSLLFSSLLENTNYRNYFFGSFVNHLSTTFSPQNILDAIHSFETLHSPLVSEHVRRWNRPGSFAEWQNALDNLKTFVILRPPLMLETLNQYFGNPFVAYPNPCLNSTTLHFYDLSEDVHPTVILIDQLGREVSIDTQINSTDYILDLGELSAGVYVLRVDMGKMNYTTRIIKTTD